MAVSNEIFIIALGMIFTYLVIYRQNRLFGNIAFIGCGFAILAYGTGNLTTVVGIIMVLGSIINAGIDMFTNK